MYTVYIIDIIIYYIVLKWKYTQNFSFDKPTTQNFSFDEALSSKFLRPSSKDKNRNRKIFINFYFKM